jgi:hypothetical protein
MAGEHGNPNAYARPSDANTAYQAQLDAQANAREKEKQVKAAAAARAKQQQQLQAAVRLESSLKAQKLAAEKLLAPQKTTLDNLKVAAIQPGSPGGTTITVGEQSAIDSYFGLYVSPYQAQVNSLTIAYTNAYNARRSIQNAIIEGATKDAKEKVKVSKETKTTKKPTKKPSGSPVVKNASPTPVVYKYNAPMTRTSYLNPGLTVNNADGTSVNDPSPQQQTTSRTISDPGNYERAENAWKGVTGAKGTIQMSRQFLTSLYGSSTGKQTDYDDQLYGFKFLYNPKEVGMTWGIATGVNWEVVQSGLDKSTPVSLGLLNSTISFTILLNRTNDMAYLNSNGLITGVKDPYPFTVSTSDLQEIYKRGTMYDMEYLFKTLMGLNSTYDSGLNGRTADKGWLNGLPIELHLGDGLRYLVRVGSLEVKHLIFNDRMVPIISSVDITCHRFYDSATEE